MKGYSISDNDWAVRLQHDTQQYMYMLFESVYDESDDDGEVETVTGLPFCGCDVCEYREMLAFVTPIIVEGFVSGALVKDNAHE
jgi:hypothetical protein